MSGKSQGRDPYLVKSVVHSSQLLSAFRSSGEALPLREIAARSGLPKSMAFRLLYTLERCGMIEKVGENLYRSYLRPLQAAACTGSAMPPRAPTISSRRKSRPACSAPPPPRASSSSASTTATTPRSRSATPTSWSARRSTSSSSSRPTSTSRRSSRRSTARPNIPLIAIEVPHPGATYFGANNYEAGLIGGRHLGRWAKQHWHADIDEIVLIALERAGSLPQDAPDRHAGRHEGSVPAARELPRHVSRRRRQARRELRGDAPPPARHEVPAPAGRRDQRSRARSARCARSRKPAAPRAARSWDRTRRRKDATSCGRRARG